MLRFKFEAAPADGSPGKFAVPIVSGKMNETSSYIQAPNDLPISVKWTLRFWLAWIAVFAAEPILDILLQNPRAHLSIIYLEIAAALAYCVCCLAERRKWAYYLLMGYGPLVAVFYLAVAKVWHWNAVVACCLSLLVYKPEFRHWFSQENLVGGWKVQATEYMVKQWIMLGIFFWSISSLALLQFTLARTGNTLQVAIFLFLFGSSAFYRSKRGAAQLRAQKNLYSDHRKKVIYLREFSADEHPGGTPFRPKLLPFGYDEEQLVEALQKYGPVWAISRPEDEMPTPGALRLKVPHDQWKDAVENLLATASLVILKMPMKATAGILWELQTVNRTVPCQKIILAVPKNWPGLINIQTAFPNLSDNFMKELVASAHRPNTQGSVVAFAYFSVDGVARLVEVVGTRFGPGFPFRHLVTSFSNALRIAVPNWRD